MAKTAYFDIDGTLCAPIFKTDDGFTPCFPDKEWQTYCEAHPQDAYQYCQPVGPVLTYAVRLIAHGYRAEILSVVLSDSERTAKIKWLANRHFTPDIFRNSTFATCPDDKIAYILQQHGDDLKSVVLVEDDFMTCIKAQSAGIKVVHISHILTGTADAIVGI